MTVFSILNTILIGPLKLVFEFVFDFAYQLTESSGTAIIYLSLVINILLYPLYQRADTMQQQIRDKETKLHDGIAHIKKTFSGDERMMILQTYYRQNHYKPMDALKGSISLLLQIPFFMAAYQFLSTPGMLNGDSYGIIVDLGIPDGLLALDGITVNLLPIIMTVVNMISSAIYLKGFPLKNKLQLYAMALFFLIFLYSSPAGLVLYWTLNNIFSLLKNAFKKQDIYQKILWFIIYVHYLVYLAYVSDYYIDSFTKRVLFIIVGHLPLIAFIFLKNKHSLQERGGEVPYNHKLFGLSSVFLTILIGCFIPSVYIAASPQEYVNITSFFNPLWYIVSALCLAAGTFLIWMRVFYWLANPKGKMIFSHSVWIMCGIMLINYMFFGTNLGIISSALQYENGMSFSGQQQLLNLLLLIALAIVMYYCVHKWNRAIISVLIVSIIALGTMSSYNFITIKKSIDTLSIQKNDHGDDFDIPHIQLSKTGHNVIVIMLDRAMGEYIPYIFNEKPEMKAQFSGFTYYSNTISFGSCTNLGAPALLGGYEYTPVEMNRRNTESLVSKHNEALKVMPAIFYENGYDVTVCDPPYANYESIPDLSIYKDYPNMKTYITKGLFDEGGNIKRSIKYNNKRNFFCFSIMKGMPLFLQPAIYNEGLYHQFSVGSDGGIQIVHNSSLATGVNSGFMESYNVLVNLSNITQITEDTPNTFLFLENETTHDVALLQEPDYIPTQEIDNTSYDTVNKNRFTINGRELKISDDYQMRHYHSNMAALICLGKWFDYLRENDVYDNTRIILVSDHGHSLAQSDELMISNGNKYTDMESYFPLLMVKDFNSRKFITSDEFMTNADVPTLAMNNIIQDPVNPFTGKKINNDEKYVHEQFIILSGQFEQNGNTYLPAKWASVKDNIWDTANWTFFDGMTVLNKHAAP